jgi:hypothetical protein
MRQPAPTATPAAADQPQAGRRNLLKAWAPALPLAGGLSASALLAMRHPGAGKPFASARFTGMPAPTLDNPAAMASHHRGSALEVTFADGSKQLQAGLPALLHDRRHGAGRQGRHHPGRRLLDINNQPIIDRSVPGKERQFFSDCPDGSSLLTVPGAKVPGVKGNAVFAVVQFEYTTRDQKQAAMYGQLPSPIAVLTLDQDPSTGKLSLVKYHNVDTSQVNGLWITCGASLSPWNTHLSSGRIRAGRFGHRLQSAVQGLQQEPVRRRKPANPYHYGHLPEVTVNPDGTGSIKKHYCLGRISHELVQVMPDQRTVLGDDATNGGLFMFIADAPPTCPPARSTWRNGSRSRVSAGCRQAVLDTLGSATSAEIKALADRYKAADIMDVRTTDPADGSFTKIPFNGKFNWVCQAGHGEGRCLPGNPPLRRPGRWQPGLHQDGRHHRQRPRQDRLLGHVLRPDVDAQRLRPHQGRRSQGRRRVCAEPARRPARCRRQCHRQRMGAGRHGPAGGAGRRGPEDPDALGNLANRTHRQPGQHQVLRKAAHPVHRRRQRMHVNNFLWAYNVDTKALTRVLSCPAGAESTGLHAVDEINGWTYIMSNFQHAGDWEGLHDKVKDTLDPLVRANYKDRFGATVGYLTGLPQTQELRSKGFSLKGGRNAFC